MIRLRSVLTVDPFSLDAAGRPWVDVHWLFQLLVYGGFKLGGLLALVAAKAIVVAGGAAVLLLAVERGATADAARDPDLDGDAAVWSARLALVVLLLGVLLAVRPLLLLRPVVLTLLFLALFCWMIERYRSGGRARALWLLPALQIVWVNCQGLSPLGPALILCHALGGAVSARAGRAELPPGGPRRLLTVAAACLGAGFITPYGVRGFLFPLRLLSRLRPTEANVFSQNIAENVPPFLLERSAPGQLWHLPWFLALVALSFAVGRRHLVLGRCLAAVTFLGLGLLATRNVLLAYWIGAPIVALNVAPALARRLGGDAQAARQKRRIGAITFALSLAGLAVLTVFALRRETALAAPAPFRVPADSAALIAERGGQGAIFAADHYGGYLIWTLYPQHRSFIDTRLILRTPAEYETFLAVLADPNLFEALARKHGFAYALLPTAFPDRYLRLVQHLYRAPDWKLIHTDGTETLFAHDPNSVEAGIDLRSRDVTRRLLAALEARHQDDASVLRAARLQLARLQLVLGHIEQAEQVVASAPAGDVEVLSLRALARFMAGDLAAAEAHARTAMAADSRAVTPLNLLARVAFERGDRDGGLGWLRRALAIDPHDTDALTLLDSVEAEGRAGRDRPAAPPPETR